MSLKNRKLIWISTAIGLVSLIGSVYATKPGNCPSVKEGPSDKTYSVAFVYGGNSEFRATEAAKLYESGYFRRMIPLGTEGEIDRMKDVMIDNGVNPQDIIEPVKSSVDTFTNIKTGNLTVEILGLGDDIAHVSGDAHIDRIAMLNEKLAGHLNSHNDGYFPIEGDIFGRRFWKSQGLRNSDVAAWYACVRDRQRN